MPAPTNKKITVIVAARITTEKADALYKQAHDQKTTVSSIISKLIDFQLSTSKY